MAVLVITLTKPTTDPLLTLHNTTNGGGAVIRFLDTSGGSQPGNLTYRHADSQSQGGGASWHFVAEDQTHVVVGDGSKVGRVIVKSGSIATKCDYAFFDDINTGMYRAAADTVRLAGGGVYNLSVSATNAALYYQSGLRFQTTDNGASVAGALAIAGATDAILDLNQTGTNTGWSYINFKTLGTRNYYVGQDASKNFNIYNDNIDVVAISVSYASNLTTIGGDLTVSGGDIVSMTTATLLGRGNVREDRRETFILPGVLADGSPNNLQINNSSFYFNNILGGPGETKVFDGSVVRLQELSLSYSFPQDFLDKTPFGALSLTATGFNLWYDAYNMPEEINFDPNVAGTGVGNARGFDFINGPSTKRYGISLKASF